MWATKKQTGFTIVETLIVLAVTAAMFLTTSLLVSGQIAKAQYRSGMEGIQTMVRDAMNDVQTGYFPDIQSGAGSQDYCGGGLETLNESGKSSRCVLAGKRVTFTETNMQIDTLALDASSTNPISVGNQGAFKTISALNESKPYPASLKFTGSYLPNPTTGWQDNTANQVINILYSLYSSSFTGTFVSGAQGVTVYDETIKTMAGINGGNGRTLCFTDGSRTGSVTVGIKGGVDVSLDMDDRQCN